MGGSVETLNDILRLRDLESRWPGAKQKEIELLAWLKIHPKATLAERVAGSAFSRALEAYGLNPQIFPDPYIICRHSIDKKTGQTKFFCRKLGEGENINYDKLCFNKQDIEKYELETPDLFNDLQELLAEEVSSVVDIPKGKNADEIDNEAYVIELDETNNETNLQSNMPAQDEPVVETPVYDPTTASHLDKVREAARLEIENKKLPKERKLKQAEMAKKVLGTGYGHQDPTRQYRALRDEAIRDGLIPE